MESGQVKLKASLRDAYHQVDNRCSAALSGRTSLQMTPNREVLQYLCITAGR